MSGTLKNWAGNYEYSAARVHFPEMIEQVQDIVRASKKVRTLGSRHSFNSIADCPEDLISLEKLEQVIEVNSEQNTVTVSGGVKYGELCGQLFDQGFAIHNLASLPHISVAGACATATHGSGIKNGNLATAVSALEIVVSDGEVVQLSHANNPNIFDGAVIGLGGLGVVTKLTLEIRPTFDVRQLVYEHLPFSGLESHFDAIMSSGYSVSLFTNWQTDVIEQIWVKQHVSDDVADAVEPDMFGATLATKDMHPIAELSAVNCTKQMGVRGPWHERLPHFRMDFTPSNGEELQSEYFVSRQYAVAALTAVSQLGEHLAPFLLISEVRAIAADQLWLSPCYQQDCVAIHFTWKRDWPGVKTVLPHIEQALAPFNARPHWGKLFTMSPTQLQSLYEKLPEFQDLLKQYDRVGKFRNQFLDTYIFGA